MSVVIFGNGPMPDESSRAVMAPGSRTWQMVRTVAQGLAEAGSELEGILVINLDGAAAGEGDFHARRQLTVATTGKSVAVEVWHLGYEDFVNLGAGDPANAALPADLFAVVATGSVQPYSTAARFAQRHHLPLWVDIFGDPLSETQSQLELMHQSEDPTLLDNKVVHVWKLLLDGLLGGDRFSALSMRQRHAIQGQLGCAGRLNQFTADQSVVDYLPYAVFPDDSKLAPREVSPSGHYTVMWCGSFNTWMDVPTLTKGLTNALAAEPNLRLLVVGGRIAGYNEISYNQFLSGIRQAGVEGSVRMTDWQPLAKMHELYTQADLGLSIDRFTYEAELGSRTRLVNFLAAGVPVASTVVTELSVQLERHGYLVPFELGNAASLTDLLLSACNSRELADRRGQKTRDFLLSSFNAEHWGKELRSWIAQPAFAADKSSRSTPEATNQLVSAWTQVREPLGL